MIPPLTPAKNTVMKTNTAEKSPYSVSAGRDYAHPLRRFEFCIWRDSDESLVHRGTGYSSKVHAHAAAVRYVRTLPDA